MTLRQLRSLIEPSGRARSFFLSDRRLRFKERSTRYGFGDKTFTAPNPKYGALLTYYLPNKSEKLELQILDEKGALVRKINAPGKAGLNRAIWDLRYPPPHTGQRGARGVQALPGNYVAHLVVDGQAVQQPFLVHTRSKPDGFR